MSEANIRAIGRGLKVLQVINQHRSLNMMQISRHSEVPYPTACRIVETLVEEGMIERERTRKHYRPTTLVKTLSVGCQEEDALALASRRHIDALTRDISWPLSICTRVGMTMMIRESSHAIAPYTLNLYHPGYTLPLLESSSGKAYLAFSDECQQQAVMEHLRRIHAESAERIIRGFQALLADIREKGYSVQDRIKHTANPGKTSAISMPIISQGMCAGTVTLAFFSSTMTMPNAIRSFVPKLRLTAEAIAADLAQQRLCAQPQSGRA